MEKTRVQIWYAGRTLRWLLKGTFLVFLTGVVCCVFSCRVQGGSSKEQQFVFRRQDNEEMKIALTFDDGPHPLYTERILNVLERYDVKATFFVVGKNAELYPTLVEQIARGGHEIGNHTYSHGDLSRKSGKEIRTEIEAAEKTLLTLIGYTPSVLRPPGGAMTPAIRKAAMESGYALILWSIDTRDWAHTGTEKMLSNIRTHISSGDIILFHDYISGDSFTVEVLETVIPELLSKGYSFVTVSELIGQEKTASARPMRFLIQLVEEGFCSL